MAGYSIVVKDTIGWFVSVYTNLEKSCLYLKNIVAIIN